MTIATTPIWVDTQAELESLCARWQQQAAIAIDTEFMRSQTYYPHAGLIQVGDGQGCYLIDPLAIDDLSALATLMTHPGTVKVIHSCSEDLEVFRYLLDVVPKPMFDTQIAAAFANFGFSQGYAALIQQLLSVGLEKGETRSDWMQRPLSQSQLHYAALDVAYLLVAYGKILAELKALGRLEWVREECAILVAAAEQPTEFDDAYTKIKLAWKLYPDQLAILRDVCVWRERTARELDIPRNRLMKEGAAWELARRKPTSAKQLANIEGMGSRALREYSDTLLALIAKAEANGLPDRMPKPFTPRQGEVLKRFKAIAQSVSDAQRITPEILTRKKDLEALARSVLAGQPQLPDSFTGWRYPIIGELLHSEAQALVPEYAPDYAPEDQQETPHV
ncbi:ribonuclease D [Simiduia aestuariiviva]|uniref:Ribonuclease D n=1 Tax=Simiduia aestuariiviva TaxID=1510459 RepID=A0A839URE1_9GAMM|nr:ribonuclease D [Simiduia aestuariiviva]MBB3169039.1 ribonuclease D [Simiduia aestuariiviva]